VLGPYTHGVPELPEVETVRAGLEPVLVGRRIVRATVRDARLTAPVAPREVARRLTGRRVEAVRRRGKYLLIDLSAGLHLVSHLRMTGSFRHWPRGRAGADPHVRAVLRLDDGGALTYRDVRRFGTWHLLAADELDPYLDARLGPEPLGSGFTTASLARALARRRAPIKAAVLDQRVAAGVGNIYADEALWEARLHPLTPAGELGQGEVAALRRAVRAALRRGIARQGATLRDYRTPSGDGGGMQDEFRVYGRAGEPCLRCGTACLRTTIAGRTATYCPACQRRRG
jgi:formamidopyrimidine-DNA glycosylase